MKNHVMFDCIITALDCTSFHISLKFVPVGPIDMNSALFQKAGDSPDLMSTKFEMASSGLNELNMFSFVYFTRCRAVCDLPSGYNRQQVLRCVGQSGHGRIPYPDYTIAADCHGHCFCEYICLILYIKKFYLPDLQNLCSFQSIIYWISSRKSKHFHVTHSLALKHFKEEPRSAWPISYLLMTWPPSH